MLLFQKITLYYLFIVEFIILKPCTVYIVHLTIMAVRYIRQKIITQKEVYMNVCFRYLGPMFLACG